LANAGLDKYKGIIRRLFPVGWAWRPDVGTVFEKLISSLAVEPCRVEERANVIPEELDPRTTFEMVDNWERLLRIPDECTPEGDPGLSERRQRILQKLTTGGGQSPAFYKLIAQQLGYDVDVIEVINFESFKVGKSRVGDALHNTDAWQYTFMVKAPAALVRYFRVGQSTVGERLVLIENETLECVIRRYAPAHTTVLFSFG
jgi:uncharacterized protein YmfQ (DUF2313 family)